MMTTMTLDRLRADAQLNMLLTTKLHIPPLPSHFVSRSRLTQQLSEGLQGKLTLICAPAGFGKTSLLSEWHAALPKGTMTVGWVSLDKSDNSLVRFLSHVIAALEQVHPGIGKEVLNLLHLAQPAPMELLLTTFINTLSAVATPIVLILDDYHVVETTQIHQALIFLLEYLPPQLHLILASRSDVPLPLARLRSQRYLHEVRADALRFTLEETVAFLQNATTGLPFTEAEVSLLEQRTEGWIAGLRMAALSLNKRRLESSDFIKTFAGNHRYIVDYFNEEVLHQQPEDIQTFLLQTSILEQLSGPLCNAVTGLNTSQAMLEQIEQANLFLVSLDEERNWYRYHSLLTDVLRRHLQQSQHDLIPQLHRRAAVWYEQQGHIVKAVSHALSSGNHELTARLIEQVVDTILLSGEYSTLQQWLHSLPTECLQQHPRLSNAQATLLTQMRQVGIVEPSLDTTEKSLQAQSEEVQEMCEEDTCISAELDYLGRDTSHLPVSSHQVLAQTFNENVCLGKNQNGRILQQAFSLSPLIEPLSGRELEVLHLMATGQSNCEIAQTLVVSTGTVKTHLKHIFGKLDVHTRTQALARSIEFHLLPA